MPRQLTAKKQCFGLRGWVDVQERGFLSHGLPDETAVPKAQFGGSPQVIGKPSPTLLARMTEKEAQRIEHQRGVLGERGLLQRGQALDKAVEANEVGPSKGLW